MERLAGEQSTLAFRVIEEIHYPLVSAEPRDVEAWRLLAAGQPEHLLAENGESVIEAAEALAASDPEFRKLLSGVWRNATSDGLHARVQGASDPSWRFT